MRKPAVGGPLPAIGSPVVLTRRVQDPYFKVDIPLGTRGYVFGHEPYSGEVRIRISEGPHQDYYFVGKLTPYGHFSLTTPP
jgi:hypothetical protein